MSGVSLKATSSEPKQCPFFGRGLCLLGEQCKLSHEGTRGTQTQPDGLRMAYGGTREQNWTKVNPPSLFFPPQTQPDSVGLCPTSNALPEVAPRRRMNFPPPGFFFQGQQESAPKSFPSSDPFQTGLRSPSQRHQFQARGLQEPNLKPLTPKAELGAVPLRNPFESPSLPRTPPTRPQQTNRKLETVHMGSHAPTAWEKRLVPKSSPARPLGRTEEQSSKWDSGLRDLRPNPKPKKCIIYFCHQCKQDLIAVKADFSCPLCGGQFLEESQSVERVAVPEDVSLQRARPERSPVGPSGERNSEAGFAWVPPSRLLQSFLGDQDKLYNMQCKNPFAYLEHEDCPEGKPVFPPKKTCPTSKSKVGRKDATAVPTPAQFPPRVPPSSNDGDVGQVEQVQEVNVGKYRRNRADKNRVKNEIRRATLRQQRNDQKAELESTRLRKSNLRIQNEGLEAERRKKKEEEDVKRAHLDLMVRLENLQTK